MPTYGFRCPEGHEVDRFYKTISAAPPTIECPECGKLAERQLHGGAGLLFKGSGFYLTDYGKNAHRPDAAPKAAEKAAEKATEKAPEKASEKADVKAEAKSEPKPKTEASKAEPKPAKKPAAE